MKKWLLMILTALFLAGCGAGGTDEVEEVEQTEETGETEAENEEQATEAEGVFKVAVIPSQSIGEMETGINNLEAELSEKLNREVEVEYYPSYNAVVEAINYSHIDLAYLGPVTYVLAHEQSGAKAVATQLIDGEPYYYSYIITHVDAEWETLEELLADSSEVDFAFGSMSSTSGSVIPSVELYQRGVFRTVDDTDFQTITYTGSHDITAQSVQNKQVDAGAIDSAIFQALIKEGSIDGDQFKIIWESDQLYQYPWVVPGDMDESTIALVQEAFENIDDEEILTIFGGASAFIATSDEEYSAIVEAVQAAREIGLLEE
ncbi:phosphate/phosphite/phosphonate ABC transporter substrate-binding protein [Anaerobacillus sp. MEB173]|uniref:phosphate/phosphite/phosphonate ABC transporter substrate-binding protein n=1 Tax=Anaerobacillus sp. MEB173 TaxID=3383345 RepID=UPI003F8F8D53